MESIVLKYEPKLISETLVPSDVMERFSSISNLNHLLLYGTAGLGKTVFARALCRQHNLEVLEINASIEGKIDVLDNKIKKFCTNMSIENFGKNTLKIVILDEVDGASKEFFEAFKPFVERYSKTTRFIMITNIVHAIPEQVKSRFESINFNDFYEGENKKQIYTKYYSRLSSICKSEDINIEQAALQTLVKEYFPDFRQCLTVLQSLKSKFRDKEIKKDDVKKGLSSFTELFDMVLGGESDEVIFNNINKHYKDQVSDIFIALGSTFLNYLKMTNANLYANRLGNIVILVAKYQYESSFVIDKSISLLACIYEIKKIMK